MYIHIYIYICICIYIYISLYMYIYICIYTYIYIYVLCIYIHISLSLFAAARMWVRHRSVVIVQPEGALESRCDSQNRSCYISLYMYIHVCIYMYVYIYMYIYICIYSYVYVSFSFQPHLSSAYTFNVRERILIPTLNIAMPAPLSWPLRSRGGPVRIYISIYIYIYT